MNLIHVMGEGVVDVDALSATLWRRGVSRIMFSSSYLLAGCDFSTGTYGVSHVHYLGACVRHATFLQSINDSKKMSNCSCLLFFRTWNDTGLETSGTINARTNCVRSGQELVASTESCIVALRRSL